MKWLKDIDSSFDALLTDCYQQREMEMERHINQIRFFGLMALFVLELFIGTLSRGFDLILFSADIASMAVTGLLCLLIHRIAKSAEYKPWLKYLSILMDYVIILLITLELEYLAELGHFMQSFNNTEFELMIISILVLFNVMSAFRQGKVVIYYSTLCCFITGTIILEQSGANRSIELHEQIVILFSGLLAWSLSNYITNTYTRLRHRERLLRYLPQKLVAAVEQGNVDINPGGERKHVTVLMADIRHFTPMCEQHDPEVITLVLNRYFSAMTDIIFNHNGMIDKFIGDAIMAVFGTPQNEGNSALDAILSAREMHQKLSELNTQFAKEGLPLIEMGIGIHSGEAIAGNIGSECCMDYTVIGDTVNVAARLERKAKELDVPSLISKQAAEQSELSDLIKLPDASLKGRAKSISVYTDSAN